MAEKVVCSSEPRIMCTANILHLVCMRCGFDGYLGFAPTLIDVIQSSWRHSE